LVSECRCWDQLVADSIVHCVYSPGSQAIQDVVSEIEKNNNNKDIASSSRCDGSGMEIDRKKLGAVVFDDPNAVPKLEQIVWPHVKTLIANKISTLDKNGMINKKYKKLEMKQFTIDVVLLRFWNPLCFWM
jgi:dephospho-CoA kinase